MMPRGFVSTDRRDSACAIQGPRVLTRGRPYEHLFDHTAIEIGRGDRRMRWQRELGVARPHPRPLDGDQGDR